MTFRTSFTSSRTGEVSMEGLSTLDEDGDSGSVCTLFTTPVHRIAGDQTALRLGQGRAISTTHLHCVSAPGIESTTARQVRDHGHRAKDLFEARAAPYPRD